MIILFHSSFPFQARSLPLNGEQIWWQQTGNELNCGQAKQRERENVQPNFVLQPSHTSHRLSPQWRASFGSSSFASCLFLK